MAELELSHVFKDYKLENKDKFTALRDINISFEKGELVSIVGESGSGKSTLMNLIGGLDSDYQGEIKIDGIDLKSFKDKQLDDYRKIKIGFVFQSFNLIPHLSVLDNVTIALTLSNVKDSVKNARAMEILSKLGLKDHVKKKPTQLSGGQKQRVAIARALINNPDIILADEPTGALDSDTTVQILQILKDIADRDNKLVIMVTHSEKVASISSRIVEISDGKIIRDEKNAEYKKNENSSELIEDKDKQNAEFEKQRNGHLSFFSALKLSFHNMWASKTKNLLMSIGVSISLIALILMLSFGAGLTGYINDVAQGYSNPNYVTISKSGRDKDGNKLPNSSMLTPSMFEESEITEIVDELNGFLNDNGNDFQIITSGESKNITYGFSMPTIGTATIQYTPEQGESVTDNVFYAYTTPPYYSEDNLLSKTGHMSGQNEIMLSRAALKMFGYDDPEQVVENQTKVVLDINFKYDGKNIPITKEVTVSAIVDVSVFSNMMVMYIDYGFLNECVLEAQEKEGAAQTGIKPSLLFIETDGKATTDAINSYISKNRADLSGSIEEQLASMFSEMMSTFSIALAVISGISLVVAMIMILVVLYMSVSERTREIGVLKSIGARKKDIKMIFSTESFLVGILSGIVGIVLSLILGGVLTIVFNAVLGFAPISMMWYYFLMALGLSILISVLAGLYPGSKAAKLDPVESLRHE